MNEPKPMSEQMRDRANFLEKVLGLGLWCWQDACRPFTFLVGFDLNVSASLNFRERESFQDLAKMKLALVKGIVTLEEKLKEIKEYEHNRQSRQDA